MNENFQTNDEPKRKMETKQDVQKIQEQLLEKKELIIDNAPSISLSVKNAPFYLSTLFEQDGKPKGDFRVSERYQKRVCIAFKHPHKKSTTGEMYWGELGESDFGGRSYYPKEYIIQATPTFLSDEELELLQRHHKLTKRINNIDIEFIPPVLQSDNYSARIEKYREDVKEPRSKIQEINGIISELEGLKSRLPMGTREVLIVQDDEPKNSPGYPHK